MVQDAARNLRFSKQQTALLAFYADCKEGFRPARRTISKKIGIPSGTISTARKSLCNHGIISYHEKRERITLHWDRIRAFAMLDKPLTKDAALHGNYFVHKQVFISEPTLGELAARYRDEDAIQWDLCPIIKPNNNLRALSVSENCFIAWLSGLTEAEYNLIFPLEDSSFLST